MSGQTKGRISSLADGLLRKCFTNWMLVFELRPQLWNDGMPFRILFISLVPLLEDPLKVRRQVLHFAIACSDLDADFGCQITCLQRIKG